VTLYLLVVTCIIYSVHDDIDIVILSLLLHVLHWLVGFSIL
jgi:hypothetical protein